MCDSSPFNIDVSLSCMTKTALLLFLGLVALHGGAPEKLHARCTQDDTLHQHSSETLKQNCVTLWQQALNQHQQRLLTDYHRSLQSFDVCQALLDDTNLKTCSCVPIAASYNITCNNFCQLCLDPAIADVCIQYSFSTIYSWLPVQSRFGPVIGRTIQVQTGKDSSKSTFWLEEKFAGTNGERTSCEALVNGQICSSCSLSTGCSNGLVLDCTNRIPFPPFDDCNEVQVEKVPLNSVFVGRNRDYFDLQTCATNVVGTPTRTPFVPPPAVPSAPQPTINMLPPKKPLPIDEDDSKDESKLFDEGNRGNLNRRLTRWRRRGES